MIEFYEYKEVLRRIDKLKFRFVSLPVPYDFLNFKNSEWLRIFYTKENNWVNCVLLRADLNTVPKERKLELMRVNLNGMVLTHVYDSEKGVTLPEHILIRRREYYDDYMYNHRTLNQW